MRGEYPLLVRVCPLRTGRTGIIHVTLIILNMGTEGSFPTSLMNMSKISLARHFISRDAHSIVLKVDRKTFLERGQECVVNKIRSRR
jgi:hypothetical protein